MLVNIISRGQIAIWVLLIISWSDIQCLGKPISLPQSGRRYNNGYRFIWKYGYPRYEKT
ncbi:MAG: hypothetical protein AB8V10_03160 [Francisella endosymbiont of Hyalomma asiaticum]